MGLDNFYGQKNIIKGLWDSIKSEGLSHSYIFEGPDGIGKLTLAKVFSQAVLCLGYNKPCGECGNCRLFLNKNHPDIKIISLESNILIEHTRDVIRDIHIRPYYNGKKIYIIEDVHKMTDQAQNSLLKTLEEPPEYALIILTTNSLSALLPTIVSRCVVKKFIRNTKEEIVKYIENNHTVDTKNFELLAVLSEGIIGNVRNIIETDYNTYRKTALECIKHFLSNKGSQVFDAGKKISDCKDNIDLLLYIMILLLRDLLLIIENVDQSFIINKDYIEDLKGLVNKVSTTQILDIIDSITITQNNIIMNANFSLAIDSLCTTINTK